MGHAHLGILEGNPDDTVQSTLGSLGMVPFEQQLYEAKRPEFAGNPGYVLRTEELLIFCLIRATPAAILVCGSKIACPHDPG
jgi:hypothetical protein